MGPRNAPLLRRLVLALVLFCGGFGALAAQPVLRLQLRGPIGPASAEYVEHGLQRAQADGAQLVVLELDTPGGLDTAMRDIVRAILASPVPVAAYVGPRGARAASAGTYILYASHIAAMAPATNLGAATPVAIGLPGPGGGPGVASAPAQDDAMAHKQINDAAAYLRGLAQLRGRNAEWAERTVREAVSLSAADAQAQHVIDLIADDVADLLRQLDGRSVARAGGAPLKLATAGVVPAEYVPDWRVSLLATLSNPSLALVLMMIGIYGLIFEFMNPGFVAPGVIGALCLLVGLYALQMLPLNHAGLALIALGIAFFVAEAFVPSYGALGLGGIAAFGLGVVMLFDTDVPGYGVPWGLVVGSTLGSALLVIGITTLALRARRRPLVAGASLLLGAQVRLLQADGHAGWALVEGERWRVHSTRPLVAGQQVKVLRVDGLTLEVEPVAAPGGS